jgi:hypothetical protein
VEIYDALNADLAKPIAMQDFDRKRGRLAEFLAHN